MRKIRLPMDMETRDSLRAGDSVLLSGTVYTARDAAHKRMTALLDEGKELPMDINGAVIYYVGPTPAKPGEVIGSAGPTTASRMDAYTPRLLDLGMQAMIGKGRRSEAVREAIVRNHAVYFIACGGAGALIADSIKAAEPVAFPDLLAEAIVKLEVEDFPCFVGIDTAGRDIYDPDQCVSGR